MEEVVVALLQVFFEFFLEVLVYIGIDLLSIKDSKGRPHGCVIFPLFAVVGMGLGALVNWMHPRPVLPLEWLRVANLIVGPILAGGFSALVARWRQREPWAHFWMAFSFILGYNLVRFDYAKV